ncbi:hypothetical protein WICMUC_001035 [Wickerhamomyces mucosus]|uniref:Allantoate permease n=1 Tax=Wickerhamomyces mucosus TaxID=1378264 RepID=A0A9P8TI20_9ASCO|nr:hypothetical protein WICMUC_001035 [Wickerhamomyces mucosus]
MSFLTKWFNPTIIKNRERANTFQESLKSHPDDPAARAELEKLQYNLNEELVDDENSSANLDLDPHGPEKWELLRTKNNIFSDPQVASYYNEIYQRTNYECKDHFDPELTWTKEEERKIVWKCDWYVTFWAYIMFTALDFDRSNIAQALSANMLNDIGCTTNDYNLANTLNLVAFLAAELPSQLVSKKLGADIWIPTQLILWSIVSICQAGVKGRASFIVTRTLVGFFQGGFICDTCLWMSYFYTSKELPFRLSLFYIANPLTSVLSALLAFGLLKVKTSILPHGWEFLFLLEGVLTLIVGILSFFKMPPSAVQTKTWFRKDGWFTDREEKIVVNRVLRDDPQKGDMNNRQPVSLKELIKSLLDYDLAPIYAVRLINDIGTSPVSTYLTLTLRKLGFSTFKTNALTIPYNIITIFTMLGVGYLTEILQSRALILATIPIWIISTILPLRYWPGSQVNVWGTYALLTVSLGHCPTWPITISWCSANSNSVRTRAVSSAVVNVFSQLAGIIAANIYRADDKPLYHRGNTSLYSIAILGLVSCIFARYYYILRNRYKAKKWNALTPEQQKDYIKNTTDEGNKRLDFRFQY